MADDITSNSRPIIPKAALRAANSKIATISNTLDFYRDDFQRTLFPLKTNKILIENGEHEIKDYINKCLDQSENAFSFLPQRRVYAAKASMHLRRTVKLDPVAEYYIYDLIFRNKNLFRKPHSSGRAHYGYRFENGNPISPSAAYKAFKAAIADYGQKFKYSMSFDVASYFNNLYHHDLVAWFSEIGAKREEFEGLGQLLRQINFGRSVDCLPQGLYPTKMVGNDFLRFVDNYHALSSDKIVRFMDDIYLFSDNQQAIADDFQIIQRLIGEKGLSVNPQKTKIDSAKNSDVDREIDSIKQTLLAKRRLIVADGYDEAGEELSREVLLHWPLTDEELSYVNNILKQTHIEEEDVELILTIMGDHTNAVERRLPYIVEFFPHLTKNVYVFCSRVDDKELIASMILDLVNSKQRLMEYQLFWFGVILEEHLMQTTKSSAIISALFNHSSSTSITKAKILEIRDTRFGLIELRNEFLTSGQSDWTAWSSAVGSLSLNSASRNYRLKYFGNSSQMNHLFASILENCP